jgi:enoyl-CoA hydratase/carnithine racemase
MISLPEYQTLHISRNDGAVTLTLNRPDRLNAQTPEMWRELADLGQRLLSDDSTRVLVVRGAGRSFSSGLDTSVFAEGILGAVSAADLSDGGALHADATVDATLRAQGAFTWLEDSPFVTVAAIHGHALGAGLQIALACDLRIATQSAQLGLLEFRYGIIPDLGATQRLPRLVGLGKAKELVFSAAQIDGEEALRIGLVERVVADDAFDEAVEEWLMLFAHQPPLAVRAAKRALNISGTVPMTDGLRFEAEQQRACLHSADMGEAILAMMERRVPRYTGA